MVQSSGSPPRRGRRLAQVAVCWGLFTLVVTALWTMLDHPADAQAEDAQASTADDVAATGQFLWQRDCASCHGPSGTGTPSGLNLQGKGPAGISLVLTTGRMPLPLDAVGPNEDIDFDDLQVNRGAVAYTPDQIDALVAHASTFVDGPEVADVDITTGNVSRGGETFQINCAACHTSTGRGGALTSGQVAVSLSQATPREVVEAMRSGLGAMPVFDEATIDQQEATDVAAYVVYLQEPATPLGRPLGFIGPVAEGFVAWLVGIVGLLLVIRWIGMREGHTEMGEGEVDMREETEDE